MSSIFFSIIIPVYNVEKYLSKCLESIINQKYNNMEIILVDDGSTDGSPVICDDYSKKDSRIVVIHKENGGVSSARQRGVQIAKGEYIIFVDSDDWMENNCVELVSKSIDDTHPDIVCYGYVCDNGKEFINSELKYRMGYYSRSDIEKEILPSLIQTDKALYFPPSLWGKAIKCDFIKKYMLVDKNATIGEDGATIIPCVYHAQSLFLMKECLYYYRYNMESATKGRKVFNWNYPAIIANHIKKYVNLEEKDLYEQFNRKVAHEVFLVCLSRFNSNQKYSEIKKDIKNGLSNEIYLNAINLCHFHPINKAFLMQETLKHQNVFVMLLFSRIYRLM